MIFEFSNYLYYKNKTCEEDLTMLNEIILCIENEAYRSASIIIWIAILESLVRKLKILALNDDEINSLIIDFEDKPNEKDLLLKCKNHGLINQIEYGQLETIRQARNNYAHPNYDSPQKDDVLIYLHYAVEYVLSKPNLFSKDSAKRELYKLLNDSNFLGNANNERVKEFAGTFTKKITNDYFDEIIKTLFKMIEKKFKENDPNNHTCIKHGLIYAKVLLTSNLEYLDSAKSNYLIDEYKITVCHLFSNPIIWEHLDSRSKERIYNYSMSRDSSQISRINFINIFYKLFKADKLEDSLKMEYEEYINNSSLENLLYAKIPANLYYDKLIEEFRSYNYYQQNPAAKIIGHKDLTVFNDNQLEQLGRNILQSAEGGANDSDSIIRKFERNRNPPKAFLKGLLFETLINDDKELRIKPKYFKNVMNIVNDSQYGDEIFDEFIISIKESKPKSLKFNNYAIIFKRLKQFKLKESEYNLLVDAVKESMCGSINKYVEKIFEVEYPHEYLQYLYDCLTEENREKFIGLGYENPIRFVKFFSKFKRENRFDYKVIDMNMELITQFIECWELKSEIDKLDYYSLNPLDKSIVDYFSAKCVRSDVSNIE